MLLGTLNHRKMINYNPPNTMTTLPPIDIKLEYETTTETGDTVITSVMTRYNGDIVLWTPQQQKDSVLDSWTRLRNSEDEVLVAFHLPVVTWDRIEM